MDSQAETYRVDDGMVKLLAPREDKFIDLDGNKTTNERMVTVAEIPDDYETAKDIWHALGAYLADEKEARCGPPEGKPMHQQFAEVEPDR